MIRLWSRAGRRAIKGNSVINELRERIVNRKTAEVVFEVKKHVTPIQERVIDFETLQSWYNDQKKPAAVGDELSSAGIYARKQERLKFL